MSALAKVYYRSIKRGTLAFSAVPEELQEEVRSIGEQELANGIITQEQFFKWFGVL